MARTQENSAPRSGFKGLLVDKIFIHRVTGLKYRRNISAGRHIRVGHLLITARQRPDGPIAIRQKGEGPRRGRISPSQPPAELLLPPKPPRDCAVAFDIGGFPAVVGGRVNWLAGSFALPEFEE